jgi:hypothetical protein
MDVRAQEINRGAEFRHYPVPAGACAAAGVAAA